MIVGTYILYCRADLNATWFHVIVLAKPCWREARAVVRGHLVVLVTCIVLCSVQLILGRDTWPVYS